MSGPAKTCEASDFGKGTCKPNSVEDGHSSRRRVAADAQQRPTRRFRQWLEPPGRAGQARSGAGLFGFRFPPYLVLLRVGFTLPSALPQKRCALTAPFHPYLPQRANPPRQAVYFLWHWPSTGLHARVPDVIRHTALRSSDFPLPRGSGFWAGIGGSDRPVPLPVVSLPQMWVPLRACLSTTTPRRDVGQGAPQTICPARAQPRFCGSMACGDHDYRNGRQSSAPADAHSRAGRSRGLRRKKRRRDTHPRAGPRRFGPVGFLPRHLGSQ